jgi:hypothetical protein
MDDTQPGGSAWEGHVLLPWIAVFVAAAATALSAQGPAATAGLALRPFADYEHTAYVLMSARDDHGTRDLKRLIARHLPAGVALVLYGSSNDEDDRRRVIEDYARVIDRARLAYLALPRSGRGFWSRDGIPVPAFDPEGGLVLTDARYRHGFEPDARVGLFFDAPVLAHGFRFEGGNLMANHLGDCFIVDAGSARKVPAAIFGSHYGCRTVTRLPRAGGIGHVDERARFASAHTVLTDTPAYRAIFEARGFTVVLLPRSPGGRESYVNALVVNGTAFVPQFGRAQDADALRVYRALGFTVVGLDSKALANRGKGSIHCISMNYPRASSRG